MGVKFSFFGGKVKWEKELPLHRMPPRAHATITAGFRERRLGVDAKIGEGDLGHPDHWR